ncbi:MAG: hypothetical protein IPN09_02445 [Bacteroidetes bacterium]|nr:hypothetical protein [Bacteroidota bacterium]
MKKILLSMFFAVAVLLSSNAQGGKQLPTAKEMTTYVSTNLKLDATTTASLEKILTDSESKLKAIQAGKGTDEQKIALAKAQLAVADGQVKKLLGDAKYAEYQALIKKPKTGNNNITPEQQAKLEQYKKELGITDAQALEIAKIQKELQATKKQIKASNPGNVEAQKSQIKVANENAKKKAAAVLTPEQQAKFVEMLKKENGAK